MPAHTSTIYEDMLQHWRTLGRGTHLVATLQELHRHMLAILQVYHQLAYSEIPRPKVCYLHNRFTRRCGRPADPCVTGLYLRKLKLRVPRHVLCTIGHVTPQAAGSRTY